VKTKTATMKASGHAATARAFAELAAAVERRLLRVMAMPEGSPARDRALRAIKAGALATGPGDLGEWMRRAYNRMDRTVSYWQGLFDHSAWIPAEDRPRAEKAAKLWEREPDHVMSEVAHAAGALAHVIAAIAAELEAANEAQGSARRAA
jgi:hypothetical protein